MQQIVLPDEGAAKEALGKLTDGRSFTDVAKEAAGMDPEAVELGMLGRGELGQLFPELVETVFSLAPDVTGGPVQSPLGWHLVSVTEVEAAKVRTFDEVRGELRQAIAKELAIDDLFKLSNKLEDRLGGGAHFGRGRLEPQSEPGQSPGNRRHGPRPQRRGGDVPAC